AKQAREVVEGVELHLLPAMNPDGFTLHTRENANRVDLNRAFPDHWFAEMNAEEAGRQAEVRAVMRWTQRHHFSASASLHGGALVASYAWDGTKDKGYRPCPPQPCAAMHRPKPISPLLIFIPQTHLSTSHLHPINPSLHFSSSSHKPISPLLIFIPQTHLSTSHLHPINPSLPFQLPHPLPSPPTTPSRQTPSPPCHQSSTHYAASPDDATFRLMATTYATAHPSMALSRDFPGGITNGASWWAAERGEKRVGVVGGGWVGMGGLLHASPMPTHTYPMPPSPMPPPSLRHASSMPPQCLPHASPMPPPCLPHAPPCPDHAAMCTHPPMLTGPSSYALALPRIPSLFLACPCPSSYALALPRTPSPFLVCPRPSLYALALPRTPSPFLVRPRPSSYALALPRTPSPFLVRPRPSPYAPYRLHPLAAALLPQLWEEHRPALLALLTTTAKVMASKRFGDFYRLLPPGNYTGHVAACLPLVSNSHSPAAARPPLLPRAPLYVPVTISHAGHVNHTTNVTVLAGRPTLLHVLLRTSSPPSLHAPSIFQTRSLPPPPPHPSGLAAWLPWHWGSKRGDATEKQGVRKGGGQGGRAGGADDPSLVLPSRQQAAAAAAAGGVLSSDEVMWAVGMGSSAALAAAVVAVVLLGGLLMMVGHRRRRFLFSHRGLPLRSLPKV
ncbi:unnamed protein product, partial [Closterium sp. NIES-65]